MMLNRRMFLVSTATLLATRPLLSAALSSVTSGGIGLTLADVQSMYAELPPGQSFQNFAEPQTGATLYIDFGDTDLAQNIWVSGDLDETAAIDLIAWLCPDDIELDSAFEILTGAGSIAFRKSEILTSPFLAGFDIARSRILATWVVEPAVAGDAAIAKELTLSVERVP